MQSRDAGLDKLKSYRMTWQAEWSGTDNGKAESGKWNWVEEYSSDPKGLHWIWEGVNPGADAKNSSMEWWQIGSTTYMLSKDDSGQGQCVSFSNEDQSSQLTKGLFSPNMLGQVSNAKLVGLETVNGVPAKHYKYGDAAVALTGMGKVSGEMWVAVDGGYVVKDAMSWSGAAGFLGGGSSSAKGDGKWTWELSDVDKPVSIKAPDNCGGAANDLPVMADATEKSRFGDTLTYKSASAVADVQAFYADKMPAAGWTADGEPTKTDEMAMLQFTKDNQKAQITIMKDNDKTSVMINVTK